MQRNKIIRILEAAEWNKLIRDHAGQKIDPLLFRKKHGNSEEVEEVVKILHLYHKAQKKLPEWVNCGAALTPKSYEQASSWQTADFKSQLVSGNRLLNLSGGLGVDDVAFSRTFKEVISVDPDREVHELASYNMVKMGVKNVKRCLCTAEEALERFPGFFDLVYVDPDRRSRNSNRAFLPGDCSPDVIIMQHRLLARCRVLLIKLSPLFDVTEATRVFHHLQRVVVVSVHNEVKEVLTVQEAGFTGEPVIECADITPQGDVISLKPESGNMPAPASCGKAAYLYESGPAVVKAGMVAFQSLAMGLEQIGQSPFHISEKEVSRFLGKGYKIYWWMPVKWAEIKRKLLSEKIDRVQVTSRDFPMKPMDIYKKLNAREGGERQLIFTKDNQGKTLVYACERIS